MPSIEERLTKTGKRYYTVRIRMVGHKQITKSFDRLTDAKYWASKTESAMKANVTMPELSARSVTVKTMIQQYMDTILPNRNDAQRERYILNWWIEQIGYKLCGQLKAKDIAEARDKLKRSASTVRRYMGTLRQVCDVATHEWQLIPTNPVDGARLPAPAPGRDRVLTSKEIDALLDACAVDEDPLLYTMALIALSTGARRGEIRNLKWADVDFKRARITFRTTKNGDTRTIAIPPQVVEDLERRYNRKHTFVFQGEGATPKELRKPFEKACKRAQIEHFRFHDLRHTCATRLAETGASIMELQAVLGHRTLQMVKRYTHLSENVTRAPIERLAQSLFGNS